jgi:PAS domain S-box-containing protein
MEEHIVESSEKIVLDLNSKVRVLHVDDDSCLLKIIKECLELEGPLQVDTALSVEEAFGKLEKDKYDVVVSDYQMPEKDGLDFLKALRSKGNTIPFIIFTGKGREEIAIKALNLGANQYLNKTGEAETVYAELAHSIIELAKTQKAERAFETLEERYRRLFESAVEGILVNGSDGKVSSLNQAAANILGYNNPKEVIGKPAVDLYADPETRTRLLQELMEKGYVKERELTWKRKDGTLVEILASITVQKDEKGNLLRTEGIIRDVSERKRSEQQLRESEEKYRSLVEQSTHGIVIAQGPKPHMVFANSAMSRILGYTVEELTSLSPKQTAALVHPDDREAFFRRFRDQLDGKQVQTQNEVRGIRKDGSIVWLEVSSARLEYEGQPAGQAIFTDITKYKKAEEELRRFSTAVRTSLDGIITGDLNGKINDVNDAVLRMYGDSNKGDLIGKNILDFVAESDRTRALQDSLESMKTGHGKTLEYRALAKNGTEIPVEITTTFMKNEQGEPIGFVDIIRNITERKKAEMALKESEARYRSLVEQSLAGIIIAQGPPIHTVFVNRATTNIWGYTADEFYSLSQQQIENMIHPEDRSLFFKSFKERLQGKNVPSHYEFRALRKDGNVTWLEISAGLIEYNGRPAVQGIFADITERKKTEEALQQSERKYRELFENAHAVILLLDQNGRVTEANNAVLRYGYKREDIVGKSVLDIVPKRYHSILMQDFSQITQKKPAKNEIEIETPNGTLRAEYSASALIREGNFAGVQVIIRDLEEQKQFEKTVNVNQERFRGLFMGNPEAATYVGTDYCILEINPRFEELFGYTLEEIKGKNINDVVVPKDKMDEAETLNEKAVAGYVYHNTKRRRKDGSLVSVAVSAAPISVEGKPAGFVAIYKDITDLKNAEKRLETMNEKLQVVGGLTRHDVRNKLSAVTGNAFLLKRKYAEHTDTINRLIDMEQACTEIVRIFDFAKTYEMLGVEDLSYIDVEKTFTEAVSLFSDLPNLKIVNDCHGLTVLADSLLRQLFYNLIDNSLKYGKKVTTIKVRYEKTEQDKLEMFYEDDGMGVPVENKPRLFKEGYSTGGSTGYGLHLIKKMMEVYGWTIQEKGEPGKGAQFAITIPKTNQNGKENYHIA